MHNTAAWFSHRVAKSQHGIFSEIVILTPEMAKHILENNPNNRIIRSSKVREYASDILAGRWQVNGEPIIIANTGDVNDGQHRLAAIIAADEPIRTNITFGPERDSRLTVDMGVARTVGDFLGMEGATNRNISAAAAKMIILYQQGSYGDGSGNTIRLTSSEIRDEYWNRQKEFDNAAHYIMNDSFTKLYGGSPLSAAYVLINRANKKEAEYFFNKLKTGDLLESGNAILMMRLKMTEMRQARLRPFEKLELFLRYWNAWRSGTKIQRAIALRNEWPIISK
jgi:hypothetical protein